MESGEEAEEKSKGTGSFNNVLRGWFNRGCFGMKADEDTSRLYF